MKFDMTQPCANCPFRTDVVPYLTKARAKEICTGIINQQKTFSCHKTIDHDDEGLGIENPDSQHCAGALILLEKLNRPNQMMRIAERLRYYDRRKLKMDSPVFDSHLEFINAQGKRKKK